MRSVLVDSGALVALFNLRAKWHEHFKSSVRELAAARVPLLTTWPCVTEATHLLSRLDNRLRLLSWIIEGGALVDNFNASDLKPMSGLMRRYSNRREMDLADASLVWLATAAGAGEILTLDNNDFERYRLPGNKRFEIL